MKKQNQQPKLTQTSLSLFLAVVTLFLLMPKRVDAAAATYNCGRGGEEENMGMGRRRRGALPYSTSLPGTMTGGPNRPPWPTAKL